MRLISKVIAKIDAAIPVLSFMRTTSALQTLKRNGIKLNLDGKDIDRTQGILSLYLSRQNGILHGNKSEYSTWELSKRLQIFASDRSINEIKEQGLSEIDIDKNIFVTDLWARPLHDAFNQIWVEKSCHGKLNKYIELNQRFFMFAGTASSKEQKNIIINILLQVMRIYDPSLAIHSESVAKYATAIAREEGITEQEIEDIRIASILHDIGKLGYPKSLWDKPDLNNEDLEQTRVHPSLSVDILKHIKWISPTILDIVFYHHYYKGYPKDIIPYKAPKGALILAVADSFDAATSARKYNKKVLTCEKALVDLKAMKYPIMVPITSGESKKYKREHIGVNIHFVETLEKLIEKHPEMKPKSPLNN